MIFFCFWTRSEHFQLFQIITTTCWQYMLIQLMISAFYWCCMTSYFIYWDLFESKIKFEQYRWVALGDPQKVFLISILMQYLFLFCFTFFFWDHYKVFLHSAPSFFVFQSEHNKKTLSLRLTAKGITCLV